MGPGLATLAGRRDPQKFRRDAVTAQGPGREPQRAIHPGWPMTSPLANQTAHPSAPPPTDVLASGRRGPQFPVTSDPQAAESLPIWARTP